MEGVVEPLLLMVQQWPWLAIGWIAFLGGSIGSFMNVVVYRMPRGMSLSSPSSHCPKCRHAIRWDDNVPVVGWLRLRGRCRDCKAAIASRYPLVEAVMASVFVVLWRIDVTPSATTIAVFLQAVGLYAWHVVVISVLVCVALIDYDRQRIPTSLFVFAFAAYFLIGFAQISTPLEPGLVPPRKLPFHDVSENAGGVLVATACQLLLSRGLRGVSTLVPAWSAFVTAALVGLTLGPWHGSAVIVISHACVQIVNNVRRNNTGDAERIRWAAVIAMSTWVGMLLEAAVAA